MNTNELIQDIEKIDWLSNSSHISKVLKSEQSWDWLPTSRDQEDPFNDCEKTSDNDEVRKEVNKVYKATLRSLRKIGYQQPQLIDGPHNYTESFKGAALFACRRAAKEYLIGANGKWTEILTLYKNGYWPCGLKTDGEIVVL